MAGKPEAPLFHTAANRLGAKRPLVVGDRLDTDILGGNNAGYGHGAGADRRGQSGDPRCAARTAERPNFLIPTLADLYAPYPAVEARRRMDHLR